MLIGMPWTIACLREIAVMYPFMVFTASLLDLVCRKSRICVRDVQMGFLPLSLHQLTQLSHLPLYTVLVVSLVAARIVLIACQVGVVTGDPSCMEAGAGSYMPSGEGGTKISSVSWGR